MFKTTFSFLLLAITGLTCWGYSTASEANLYSPGIKGELVLKASFQRISAGTFTMGSPADEARRDDDESQREVQISKAFDIMKTEVTQMQWFLVMGNNPSHFKTPEDCQSHLYIDGQGICPNNPVERVSWDDAKKFISKLNAESKLKGCNGSPRDSKGCYRLPTEAEWEYAARGNTSTTYSFGNNISELGSYAWHNGNSENKTHPVGLKKANSYGLYDVHGNVWEWVEDKYNNTLQGGADPLYISYGFNRVIRGISWDGGAELFRSANRGHIFPSFRHFSIGFRLVKNL